MTAADVLTIELGDRAAGALAWDAEQADLPARDRAENLADAIARELDDAADLAEANLVQVEIIRNTTELVEDPAEVRHAVDLLMGEGRRIDGAGAPFLVQFTDQELRVLESQGYIDIAKYDYELIAEMP